MQADIVGEKEPEALDGNNRKGSRAAGAALGMSSLSLPARDLAEVTEKVDSVRARLWVGAAFYGRMTDKQNAVGQFNGTVYLPLFLGRYYLHISIIAPWYERRRC